MKVSLPGYWIALGLVVILVGWLANGEIEIAADHAPAALTNPPEPLPKVAFRLLQAQEIQREIVVQGQVEAIRSVTMRSRLDTFIENVLFDKGARVQKSALLVKLSEEDIPSLVAEASAQADLARSELKAAKLLSGRGLLAETDLKSKEAALASAQAMTARYAKELNNTRVSAPFAGVIEDRYVEAGEIVQQNTPLISILDDSKVRLVGQVGQQDVAYLSLGLPVEATLLNGHKLTGQLSFIGYQADPQMRTFRIEAELANPDLIRIIGATAKLVIKSGLISAHSISPALLTLDSKGHLSVEHLSAENRVSITPVERVRASIAELWVTGLPDEVRVITLGKGYVAPGQQVQAQPEDQLQQRTF
jgi:membrane fusion protein, multidrug efflux system